MVLNLFKKKSSGNNDKKASDDKYVTLTIREIVQETEDAVSVVFEKPDGGLEYESGQFLTLILTVNGEKIRRAYSLCTSPYVDDYPAVTVKRVKDGLMSNFIPDNLKAGDNIEVMKPLGKFTTTYEASGERHIILYGGGSGITPLMSIAKSVLTKEPASKVSLIYANRNENSIIFQDAFNELVDEYGDRLQVVHVLDEAPLNWTGPSGLLEPPLLADLVGQLPDMGEANTEHFICGPEGMMKNVEEGLALLKVPADKIHKESFVASKDKSDAPKVAGEDEGHEVTVIYEGEEHKFTVAPGTSILETALELDIDLPFSCQSGLCTACRGKCISGKVKLDEDEGLSQSELDEGFVLTCVGHPLTDDVVIEIG
ncbi:2Fe-2S iron-sulfur cluster-binding protein [Roseivirga sp. BDSF3-8]|uniref:2Fe-2S iron-sulfur cluster-binding protein n=1 Tax=Roseivirga sp. BDSF3-8 TaxID=3241598 RepID=UPI0035322419